MTQRPCLNCGVASHPAYCSRCGTHAPHGPTRLADVDADTKLFIGLFWGFVLLGVAAMVMYGLYELVFGIGAYRAGSIDLAPAAATAAPPILTSNIAAIGQVLYSRYLFLFESAGIILLVAMIGAIVLTHRDRKDSRPQNIDRQNRRRPQDATVNMRPEVGGGLEL